MTIQAGINLEPINDANMECPFIDRMKTSNHWSAPGGVKVELSPQGYPVALPEGVAEITTMVALDPIWAPTEKTFVLTWKGTATFTFGAYAPTIVSSEPGRIVFVFNNPNMRPEWGAQVFNVSGLDPADPLHDMHIVRQDQLALFEASELFNPAFTAKIAAFSTLRYMDWQNTNVSAVVEWADRTKLDSMSWSSTDGWSSVPIEVMVALANETKTDMWLCAPYRASDDYVRQMLSYVRDTLDPSLHAHLEYANEVWNWAFNSATYAKDQAAAIWGAGSPWLWFYGYRAAQVALISRDVFKDAPQRLVTVVGAQADYCGLEPFIFQGIAKATPLPVDQVFDDYTVAAYASGLGANDQDNDVILGWAKDTTGAGVTAAFEAATSGSGIKSELFLDHEGGAWAYHAAVAAKYGLRFVAYEGGFGGMANGFTGDDQTAVLGLYVRMLADRRIADWYDALYAKFASVGGALLVAYNDVGSISQWGTWGALTSIYASSPRWDALVALARAGGRGEPVAAQPAPDPTPLPAAGGTGADASPAPAPAAAGVPTGTAIGTTKPAPVDDPVDTPTEPARPTKAQAEAALTLLDTASANFVAATANAKALLAAFAA